MSDSWAKLYPRDGLRNENPDPQPTSSRTRTVDTGSQESTVVLPKKSSNGKLQTALGQHLMTDPTSASKESGASSKSSIGRIADSQRTSGIPVPGSASAVKETMDFPLSKKLMSNSMMAQFLEHYSGDPVYPGNYFDSKLPYVIPNEDEMNFYLDIGGVAFSHPPIIQINSKDQTYLTFADGKAKFPFKKSDMLLLDLPKNCWPLNFYCPFCKAYDHCLVIDETFACPKVTNAFVQIVNRPLLDPGTGLPFQY